MAYSTQQTRVDPGQVIEIIFRYRWLIICSLTVSLTMGLIRALTAERIYQASTMILIQPQEVPADYVRSVVSAGIEERISTISQQIMSRTNLEKIINQFGLYKSREGMYLEDKIENLRNRININITRSRRGQDSETFAIQYKGSKPDRVMQITNTLASYFMDVNIQIREIQAVGTSKFLDEELEKIKKTLELKEKRLAKYRSQHVGGLPSELESNLRTLDRLQTQLTDNQAALRVAKNTEVALKQQIIRQKELVIQSMNLPISHTSAGSDNTTARQGHITNRNELTRLKGELASMLLKYTEEHPDVIKLKNTIKKLENKNKNSNRTSISEEEQLYRTDPEIIDLEMQHRQIVNSIAGINADIRAIKSRMQSYEKLVEQTPKREQELQKLLRDYASIQNIYTSVLDRRLEAALSVNMEKKQKGEQFRVLDYAVRPEKPIFPVVRNIFFISFGIGCAFPAGLIYLFFVLDNRIRKKEEIEIIFDLPVLVEIPAIKKSENRLVEIFNVLLLFISSTYILSIIAIFFIMELHGIERSVNLIKSCFS